ncbi:alpha-tocopherol transfer protein-like [Leguminivora glycinivorella]|uniref:alpha-tocopherol transfer protein-like n=1 Tax=Leguminivora glycinivorella TaxID=1035111 RepID=UPI00200F45BA|nr:alpha-tocopherol transfer protein-like [Leguminivora glycinivorella]
MVVVNIVEREYEKNPEMSSGDVKNIREWMMTQPHLPHEHITDLDIILAYHRCDQNVQNTKKLIDLNFSLRNLFSFYQNRKINKSLENALKTWLITPLKTRTKDGYTAIYCQILDTDPAKFVYSDVVRAFVMVMDLWQLEEGTAAGVVVILNMDRVLMGHLYKIDLTVAQHFFYFLQEAMFVRLKEFHIINAPSFVDRLLVMLKPFMKKELLQLRVHTVGTQSLDEHFGCEELSKEIREINGVKISNETWRKLQENEKFFEDESKKRVDEAKRPGESVSISKIFSSMEGTFRALQID